MHHIIKAIEVLHGSHIGWQNNLFPWEKESIVPVIQHDCRAKSL